MSDEPPIATAADPLGQRTDHVLGWKRVGVGMAPSLIGTLAYWGGAEAGIFGDIHGLYAAFFAWIIFSALGPHAYVRKRWCLLIGVLLILPAFAAVLAMNFEIVKVEGESMSPTLREGDALLVDETAKPVKVLGMWVLEVEGENNPLIKRLVGLPGQTMEAREGRLFADGVEVYPRAGDPEFRISANAVMAESHLREPLKLGDGEYFVIGDHADNSRDSRHFGPVSRAAFKAKVEWSLRGSHGFGRVK